MTLRQTAYMTWLSGPDTLVDGVTSTNLPTIPTPMSSTLMFSATRDASYVQCVFDGWVEPERFRRTPILLYGGAQTGWYFGADKAEYRVTSGRRTTHVRFRIGPYRLAKSTAYLASYYLYDELVEQWRGDGGILDGITRVRHRLGPGATVRPTSALNRSQTTQAGFWLYVLAGGDITQVLDANPPLTPTASPERAGHLAELSMAMELRCFAGNLKFDEVATSLYENFHILVWVNPRYLRGVSQADLDRDTFTNIPPPEFIVRNVLDSPLAYYSTNDIDNLPLAPDKTFSATPRMSVRRDEDTLLLFWHDGSPIPAARNPHMIDVPQGRPLWRYGNGPSWDDWQVIGFQGPGGRANFPGLNPHTLYSHHQMPSIGHANVEGELHRDQHELPLRQRTVTCAAPEDLDDLLNYLPGNACKVRSTANDADRATPSREHPVYWITQLEVHQPQMTMKLNLVLPGDDPFYDLPKWVPPATP